MRNGTGAETALVMRVIDDESTAFYMKDFPRWSACWLHDPKVRFMGWWSRGGVTVVEGWESLRERMRRLMEANPNPNPASAAIRRERVNVNIEGKTAWATFDEYNVDTGEPDMDMPGLSRETRILEKHDGQWKIAYVGWLLVGNEASA